MQLICTCFFFYSVEFESDMLTSKKSFDMLSLTWDNWEITVRKDS